MASSSTSSIEKSSKYDVFLSFSGYDTRRNFIDHLYDALQRQGIHTFKDDERLKKRKRINDELLDAIKDSKFYIIVFSKNYASSSWCLNELVEIMEFHNTNRHAAYPVFYDVEPSEVRKQSGAIGEALAKHTKNEFAGNFPAKLHKKTANRKALSNQTEIEFGKWREALKEAANLSGWDLRNTADGHESKVIKLIVQQISLELRSINVNIDENLIGMEHRLEDLESYLKIGSNDVRMIGIKGMGGAGKTTLARAIFDKLSIQFEAKSFVESVREVSKASLSGLQTLQRQVLSELLQGQGNNVSCIHDGKNMMRNMLCGRKVLLVLDDVDHKDQLEALASEPNWFKPGSRIIITTRDEQVLKAHGVKWIREVNLLSNKEAIDLFNRHAFRRDVPIQRYETLSLKVVHYAAGLPLTIKVLGSFLCGKDEPEWIDALARLKTIPLKETLDKLELSYNSLEDDYKEIFLDVACLLKGWKKDDAITLLESNGYHARNGLRVLQQKSLIVIYPTDVGDCLSIHDHIEEMGKNIVLRQHPHEPRKHSRLWIQEEIEDILANDLGTEETRWINMCLTRDIVLKGLRNMKNLRGLLVYHHSTSTDFRHRVLTDEVSQYFPNSLRYLNWTNYPFLYLPKTIRTNNLVTLIIVSSYIEQLWEGEEKKVLNKLKFLTLDNCLKLRTLDLGLTPNLERLFLNHCYDLEELHVHGGCLKNLLSLTLYDCTKVKSRSFIKQLESLEVLKIGSLTSREIQDMITGHSHCSLLRLSFSSLGIEELPPSIENLHKLVYLNLNGCEKLKSLPRSFCSLRHLRTLYLEWCPIGELPDDFGLLDCLEILRLGGTSIKRLPDSICMLKHLKILSLESCVLLEKLPEDLGQLESLEDLSLSYCVKIIDIPISICNLKHLKLLNLRHLDQLENLPEKLGDLVSLKVLYVKGTHISHLPQSIYFLKGLKIWN